MWIIEVYTKNAYFFISYHHIVTICYRQSKTGARKWTSTFRNDMQEMQDYWCRDIVFALSSCCQLWKISQQHGKLCYLQWEDTRNCSSSRHV